MVIRNIEMDNFMAFKNFSMNMSYPNKIVNSYIENEHLKGFNNFRYKKVNILLGANASGKTTFGKMLMHIFNFIERKEFTPLLEVIDDKQKEASFSIDLAGFENNKLYRIDSIFNIGENDVKVNVKSAKILSTDNYEKVVEKMDEIELNYGGIEKLEEVPSLFCV